MLDLVRKHHISFKNAFAGLLWSFRTQPNFKIHAILAVCSLCLAWVLNLSHIEWLILIFTIIWAFSAEMINTSIESVTDLVTTEWKKEAKVAKDVAAGMMLLVSFGALIVALILFLPKLFVLFT